ncbi:uncharacterized protein LOC105834153 [Monomorium pharaonis]|uniref:uncharacterized protein LOC105834153 n=1 Tax=Monomorium pharaonis TaxID=307658 RepID=UPI00102E12AF|nr:uncharacterized protein LOC105834153 [Monomorium pharaonis]
MFCGSVDYGEAWNPMEPKYLKFYPWPACLAVRENHLPSDTPHVPILIEDILQYASLPDYTKNCIKTVQTIGEIVPGTARVACLQSITSDGEVRITLSLEKLPANALYVKDHKGRRLFIWEKFHVFKVFGMLEHREAEVVLVAHKLLKVQDIHGSLNALLLLSTVVRPMHYQ